MIKRFDIIRLKTTKRVTWLSGPASRPASPQGNWSVVAGLEDDYIMIAKDETVAKIPVSDVFKVADYDIKHAIGAMRKISSLDDLKKFPLGVTKDLRHGDKDKEQVQEEN